MAAGARPPSRRAGRLFLTARDHGLIADVFAHRVLTRNQVLGLGHFQSVPRCNARLKALLDDGYVRRHAYPFGTAQLQALYGPGDAAIPVLAGTLDFEVSELRSRCRNDVAPLFLAHTLALTDARIAFAHYARGAGVSVQEWLPELFAYHEFSVRGATGWQERSLRPDASLTLRTDRGEGHFFLEYDLGHVSAKSFAAKLGRYSDYYRFGVYADLYGSMPSAVLLITTCERRRENLLALHGNCSHFRLFATTEPLFAHHGPYGPIWQQEAGPDCMQFHRGPA